MKNILPHIASIAVFLGITFVYFYPILEGKMIEQSDMIQYMGMSKEITDYREKTGNEALWTNSMFGGMPAYLISMQYSSNLFRYVNKIMLGLLDKPAIYLFLSLIGFYIMLLIFKVDPWLSIAGAIAFSFSSYFFVIGAVGHNTKYLAISYMAPIIGGVHLTFRGRIILGSAVTGLFLAFQLLANHYQITYYTGLIVITYGIFELVSAIREKKLPHAFKAIGALLLSSLIAFGTNLTNFMLVNEYGKESMRGKSELTSDIANKTSGLDKDYATAWSYGILETMTLLVPNYNGGSSHGELSQKSETYQILKANNHPKAKEAIKQLPLYWGDQPFTSGPVYAGAIIFYLFILGLFLVKDRLKWWLLTITILSILLAWGKNFMFLTDIFLDYFPGYNKFRSVSMMLVVAEFAMPLLAILAVKKIIDGNINKAEFKKALIWSLGIFGAIFVIFVLFAGMSFDFTGKEDNQLGEVIASAITADRKTMFWSDTLRSLVFAILSICLILLFYFKKIKNTVFYIALISLLLIDMWPVDKRYLNSDNFERRKKVENPFTASKTDEYILKDPTPDFRVLNLTVNTFNDASTAYFHKSIGGYHGAKMKRYQELIDYHISREMTKLIDTLKEKPTFTAIDKALNSLNILNMLNTRYIIINREAPPIINPYALGNSWFVSSFKLVNNADEEIDAMYNFSPMSEAITDKRYSAELDGFSPVRDTTATIGLTSYSPNELVYQSKTQAEQLAVFSEIFYNKGWDAFIDGKEHTYFRVNYILRAMRIPSGEHKIEFRFKPAKYYLGEKISLASSALIILIFIGVIVREFLKSKNRG
ncbi:MAG: YfhO family protein [Bacteroidia bacterium]|nr:YfhO family protein [Bacteroidia bacterium]